MGGVLLSWRGLFCLILLIYGAGLVSEYFLYGHWYDFLVWAPFWGVPVWVYLIPFSAICTYLLFISGRR